MRPEAGEQHREMIGACVEKIAASPQFANAPRLCRFLRHCVGTALDGRANDLKESLIGMEVFNRGSSFDPRTDSIVRVDARRLRVKLEEYYRQEGLTDSVQIVFTPGSYVPRFQFLKQQEAEAAPVSRCRPASIAVLPFMNLTSDPEMEHFSDGLTEEVIATLAQIRGLRVVARTSVFQFKGRPHDIREIASQLNVDSVLEGSIRKSGTRLRVTAQLISAADGFRVWSATFDREPEDIFVLQDDIAGSICGKLNEQVPREGVRPPRNPLAYQLYLKGRYYWNHITPDSLSQALACFEQARGEDPLYSPPYAGIAYCYTLMSVFGFPPGEVMPKAKAAALKALSLDEANADAHAALGCVCCFYEWDANGAERAFRRALELNPSSAPVYQWYTKFLVAFGRRAEALEVIRLANALDPLSAFIKANMGLLLYVNRQYEAAVDQFQNALAMDPNYYWTHWHLSMAYASLSRFEDAAASGERALALSGRNTPVLGALGAAHALAGRRADAEGVIDEFKARAEVEHVSPVPAAAIYAAMGEREAAFERLERAYEERNPLLLWITWPLFDSLRGDARYESLLQRTGMQ